MQDITDQSSKEAFLQKIKEQTIIQYLIEILAKVMVTRSDIYQEVIQLHFCWLFKSGMFYIVSRSTQSHQSNTGKYYYQWRGTTRMPWTDAWSTTAEGTWEFYSLL